MTPLEATLLDLDKRLFLSIGCADQLQEVANDLASFFRSIEKEATQNAFTQEELCLFDKQASRIKQTISFFVTVGRLSDDLIHQSEEKAQQLLNPLPIGTKNKKNTLPTTEDVGPPRSQSSVIQETLYSNVFREWFLNNLADPFPSRQAKEELVVKTNNFLETMPRNEKTGKLSNEPIDYSQCSLWFINSRRRSQWTEFYRSFAHSDKKVMALLVNCLKREQEEFDAPGTKEELEDLLQGDMINSQSCPNAMAARVKECREMFSAITDWLRHISREKVADWMDDIIREAKVELQEEKAAKREQKKRSLESQEEAEEEREHQKRKLMPARRKTSFAIVTAGQSDTIQGRKMDQRKEIYQHRLPSNVNHTPDSSLGHIQFNDSSAGTTSRCSSGSSYQAPSIFQSGDQFQPCSSCSSSASSLASYDAFHRPPGSPTLRILKNNKIKELKQGELKPAQMDAQLPITNVTSLYTSNLMPKRLEDSSSTKLHSLPSDLHLETELSGGSRSHLKKAQPRAIDRCTFVNQYSPLPGWANYS